MAAETPESSNFLRARIRTDLEAGRYQGVVTRFPPEPNGFLHIGHAKAICVDFGLAEEFGGRCHLRFDDTNPTREDTRFVEAIQADVRWLGFDWGEHLYYASDYFDQLYAWALQLIQDGKAYVDSLSEEDIRAYRGTVTEPGRPSPYRDRPVDESLRLIDEMRRGLHPEGSHVVRAKGDMAHPNMKMRDPLMYRVLRHPHDRTGDRWNIYPMYDYAHGLSDAIEGVTHSICTLEFENNRALYDFFVELVGFTEPRPHQHEMARLALPYTVVSKRKLKPLVDQGIITGWDDPRLYTLAGLRRRGVPPEAIRAFIDRVGVARTNSVVDPVLLDNAIRDWLDPRSKRLMAVLDPLPVEITNWPGGTEWLEASLYPHDVPLEGTRRVPFSGSLVIERADFQEHPEPGFRRLAPGREVRLRYGYLIRATGVRRDASGAVVAIQATYDPDSRGGRAPDGRKVSATIHWVSQDGGERALLHDYGQLFTRADLDGLDDLTPYVADDTHVVHHAWVEPAVVAEPDGARVQLERTGYYFKDPGLEGGQWVRVVALKSSWGERPQASKRAPASPPQPAADPTDSARTLSAAEQAEVDALTARGFGADEAMVMIDDAALAARIEATVTAGAPAADAARWWVHEVPRVDGDVGAGDVAALIGLVADGSITHAIARDVLGFVAAGEGSPAAIVDARKLRALRDDAALAAAVERALADHPTEAEAWRAGKDRLEGFFVGAVMRATRGRADARLVKQLLAERR